MTIHVDYVLSPAESLQAQIDFLKLPYTTWVRGAPQRPDEACLVVRYSHYRTYISTLAITYVREVLKECEFIDGAAITWKEEIVGWNDHHASGKAEVIQVLEKALAKAQEYSD
jgi:hypothetical protein